MLGRSVEERKTVDKETFLKRVERNQRAEIEADYSSVESMLKKCDRELDRLSHNVTTLPKKFKVHMSYVVEYWDSEWRYVYTRDLRVLRYAAEKYQEKLRNEGWTNAVVETTTWNGWPFIPKLIVNLTP